jgi:predicted nucleotidyltransferase
MKGLTAEQIETLRDLVSVWPHSRLVLIGASALACFIDMNWRQTLDLDLTVSLSQGEYRGPLTARAGWTQARSREHRWHSPVGVMVDIIPAGPEELASGTIAWPRTGALMNLAGFRLVFERAVELRPVPGFSIEVAPLEVVALLKIAAYLDRPQQRERDLEDLSCVLEEFARPDSAERFSQEILDMGMDYELVSACLLGRRLAAMMNEEERRLVELFCSKVEDEDDPDHSQASMARAWPWHGDTEALLSRIAAFKKGLETEPDHQAQKT